jgi:hypothetical protein
MIDAGIKAKAIEKINPPNIESIVPSIDKLFLDNLRGLLIAFI